MSVNHSLSVLKEEMSVLEMDLRFLRNVQSFPQTDKEISNIIADLDDLTRAIKILESSESNA